MKEKISLAAPAYNEGTNLREIVLEWVNYFNNYKEFDFEIVICNDGSRDNTKEVLDSLATSYPQVKPIHLEKNQGAAYALKQAINKTTGHWVLLIDSDGQFPINNLAHFIDSKHRTKAKAFIGVRGSKKDSYVAKFGSWISGFICSCIYNKKYQDFNCALKFIEGDIVRKLHLEARGLNYSTDVSAKLLENGIDMVEVKIAHTYRAGGKSTRKFFKDSLSRAFFVFYLLIRRILIKSKIIFVN
jgi:dolichol-phosphate mannosyltransferase